LEFILAGGDIALICHGLEPANEFLELIRSSVNNGILSEDKINEKVFRILKLKRDMDISNDLVPILSESDIDDRIRSLKAELGE
jgi:beta-N-acetylhexosaminidase